METRRERDRDSEREREVGWKVDPGVESFYTRLKKTIPPIRARPVEYTASNLKATGAKDALSDSVSCPQFPLSLQLTINSPV